MPYMGVFSVNLHGFKIADGIRMRLFLKKRHKKMNCNNAIK